MKNNLVARVPARARVLVAALLAILLIAGLVPVGLNLAAKAVEKDGFTTHLSEDEVVLNGGAELTVGQVFQAPQAIRAGQWVTYVYGDNTYAFQPQFPIAAGEELKLTDENTIQLNRNGNAPAGATNITEIATAKPSENGQVVFELKDDALMTADTLYYYDDGNSCYTFSTPIDLGYKAGTNVARYSDTSIADSRRTNLNDKVNAKGQGTDGSGNITIVLNINDETGTANFEGNQFTKHYIYERTTSLSAGQVYLIGRRTSSENGKVKTYLVSQQTLGGNSATASLGYETPGADASMWDMGTNGIIAAPSSNHSYFIDSADLTGDEYALSEHLAQTASTANNALTAPFGIKLNLLNKSGVQFQAVNSAKNGYATDRVFGTAYTWSDTEQRNMQYLPFGDGTETISALGFGGQLAKNNGQVWSLEQSSGNYYLQNNNTFAGLSSGNPYLVVNASSLSAASSTDAATAVYPYQLKVAYKQQTATLSEDIALVAQSKTTTDFTATRMEKVSATFNYIGTKGATKTFDITYRLTDADGNPVSGTFGDVTFANGTGTMTGVANGDTFNLGWIPQGYKLATVSVLPSDTSDADAKRYQKKLYYANGTEELPETPNWAEGNANALPIPAAPTQLKYEVDDPLRNVTISLKHDGSGSYAGKQFTVIPTISDKNGTPFNETLEDNYGRTIHFVDGVPTETAYFSLGKNQHLTLYGIPNGYKVQLKSTSDQYSTITISEGDAGKSKTVLNGTNGSGTSGTHVTEWSVEPITVDNDEEFLVDIAFENIETTVKIKANTGSTNFTSIYTVKATLTPQEQNEAGEWVNVLDENGNSKARTINKTHTNSNGEHNKVFDTANEEFKNANAIPPGGRIKVEYEITFTVTKDNTWLPNGALLMDLADSSGTKSIDMGKYEWTSVKTYTLKGSYDLYPHNDEVYTFTVKLTVPVLMKYKVTTQTVNGDPALEIPVHLTGFSLNESNSAVSLSTNQQAINIEDSKDDLSFGTFKAASEALQRKYAAGSGVTLEELKRSNSDLKMTLEDVLYFAFTARELSTYTTMISPFIATDVSNENGVKFNKEGSQLTELEGYKLVAINFGTPKTKSLSNPSSSVNYSASNTEKQPVGTINIVYDMIPQKVVISMSTGKSDGAKDYSNRQKAFPVDITLLDSHKLPVRGQIYKSVDENGDLLNYLLFDADNGVSVLKDVVTDQYGKVTSYTKTDEQVDMKHGDKLILELPINYTVHVNEENIGPYTASYKAWEDENVNATSNSDAVDSNNVKIGSVLQSKINHIHITNTRNDVEDDIGLFGGKANKAFLAVVGILSLTAAAAYIYTRHNKELED